MTDSNFATNSIQIRTSTFCLDDYSDIYSDFDSRHYKTRRISEDFLNELRMDMQYRKQPLEELHLLIPESKRDENNESEIEHSLKNFFKQQYQLYRNKARRKFYISLLLLVTGIIILMLNTTLIFLGIHLLFITLLSTIMEPASWFLLWTSVDYLLYDWNDLRKERGFYERLSETKISFVNA